MDFNVVKKLIKCCAFSAIAVLFVTKPVSSADWADNKYMLSMRVGMAFPAPKVKVMHIVDDELFTREKIRKTSIYDIAFGRRVSENILLDIEYAHSSNHKLSKKSGIEFDGALHYTPSVRTKVRTDSFFINSSYQFNEITELFIPYLTAGVGTSYNKTKNTNIASVSTLSLSRTSGNVSGKATNNFAWQIGGGVIMPINKFLSFNAHYTFRDLGKIKTSALVHLGTESHLYPNPFIEGRIKTSNFLVGLNVTF